MSVRRYSVCHNVLRGADPGEDVAGAAAAGAVALSIAVETVVAFGADAITQMLADHKLSVSSLTTGLSMLSEDGARDALLQRSVDAAAAVGARCVLVTTGPLGEWPSAEADDECRRWFTRMAPLAEARDVRILLEPVHPLLRGVSYVHTIRHGVELTQELPGTGLALDVGHLWWDRHLLDDIATFGGEIGTVQLDDVSRDALRDYRYERVQLGTGDIPLEKIIAAIEATGYRGYYENESAIRLPRGERVAYARRGGEWLANVLARLARAAIQAPPQPSPDRPPSS